MTPLPPLLLVLLIPIRAPAAAVLVRVAVCIVTLSVGVVAVMLRDRVLKEQIVLILNLGAIGKGVCVCSQGAGVCV